MKRGTKLLYKKIFAGLLGGGNGSCLCQTGAMRCRAADR